MPKGFQHQVSHVTCVNLSEAGLIDSVLASGEKAGYHYELNGCDTEIAASAFSFSAKSPGQNWQVRILRQPGRSALVRHRSGNRAVFQGTDEID